MNILYLVHRIPYPPNKGDKIRSFNMIKHLSRDHRIHLGTTLDNESDRRLLSGLEEYCEDIHAVYINRLWRSMKCLFTTKCSTILSFYDKALQEYVDSTLADRSIDAVICFCSSMAEYVFKTPRYRKNRLNGVKLVMDFVDLDSDKWRQYASYSRFPLSVVYRMENRRLFKYEKKINRRFDRSVFVSPREVSVFNSVHPGNKGAEVISNGVDQAFFCTDPVIHNHAALPRERGPKLVFTGVMDYFANEDGVTWFCKKIFPAIKAGLPDALFYIVGNNPSDKVWSLSEIEGVRVTGYVEDIREYYCMADVCVIPLRIARGLQNKVLEAMASEKAVVATTNAADGILCRDKENIRIEDDEKRFADAVVHLLQNEDKRRKMGGRAIENVREHYSWTTNISVFDALLRS